jgi:NitT/TauT family transport system substrate-binding protein
MNRTTAVALIAAAAAMPRLATAQTIPTLEVAGVPEDSATPVVYGVQSGIFRRAGVNVDITPQGSGSAVTAGVVGGSYQVGKSSIVPLIIAVSKRIPVKIVAAGGIYRSTAPNIAMVVSIDSPLKTAADLNGKTVGVSSPDDLYTLGLKAWMDKNGGNAASLKLLSLPQSEIEAALAAKRIDAGASGMPQLQSQVDGGKVRVFCDMCDAIAATFMFSAWFSSDQTIASRHADIAAFLRAERQAATYTNAHPADAVAALAAFTKIEPAVIAKMVRVQNGTTLDPKLIQPAIDVCARYGVIPERFDAATMFATGI